MRSTNPAGLGVVILWKLLEEGRIGFGAFPEGVAVVELGLRVLEEANG